MPGSRASACSACGRRSPVGCGRASRGDHAPARGQPFCSENASARPGPCHGRRGRRHPPVPGRPVRHRRPRRGRRPGPGWGCGRPRPARWCCSTGCPCEPIGHPGGTWRAWVLARRRRGGGQLVRRCRRRARDAAGRGRRIGIRTSSGTSERQSRCATVMEAALWRVRPRSTPRRMMRSRRGPRPSHPADRRRRVPAEWSATPTTLWAGRWFDEAHSQRVADLEVYVRQEHGRRDSEQIGPLCPRRRPHVLIVSSSRHLGTAE